MQKWSQVLVWMMCVLSVGPLAYAQDEVVVEETTLSEEMPANASAAAQAWVKAWGTTPNLVTMKQVDSSGSVAMALEERLKQLGEKGFSNREWRSYWAHQGETAQALLDAVKGKDFDANRTAALEAWVELAQNKVANQEVYFEAIESERDAVEGRLESLLEPAASAEADETEESQSIEEPNAYDRLRLHKAELTRHIEVQMTKKRAVEAERLFIER
jgi:hypothetical protein